MTTQTQQAQSPIQNVGNFGKEPEVAGTAKDEKSNVLSNQQQTQYAFPAVDAA